MFLLAFEFLVSDQEMMLSYLCSVELQKSSQPCLSHMSDASFSIYIEFFNHLDNVCFFLHSTVWQERTEDTVSMARSDVVVGVLLVSCREEAPQR